MQDNDGICEEVRALLDRMGKFPEEFITTQLPSKWYKVTEALNLSENDSPFTVAEYRALHKKLHDLRRYEIKQAILKAIVHVEDERYGQTYTATLPPNMSKNITTGITSGSLIPPQSYNSNSILQKGGKRG